MLRISALIRSRADRSPRHQDAVGALIGDDLHDRARRPRRPRPD